MMAGRRVNKIIRRGVLLSVLMLSGCGELAIRCIWAALNAPPFEKGKLGGCIGGGIRGKVELT